MRTHVLFTTLVLSLAACGKAEEGCLPNQRIYAFTDADGDGFGDSGESRLICAIEPGLSAVGGDCDDSSSALNPGVAESCNGIDDDCDGRVDEFFLTTPFFIDLDGDGWGAVEVEPVWACVRPANHTDLVGDCDDSNADVSPAGDEVCNGIDDDCDGFLDDTDPSADPSELTTYYRDADGDGFGNPQIVFNLCAPAAGAVDNNLDCNDLQAGANPNAQEICNVGDDDCDGLADDDDPSVDPNSFRSFYPDADFDSHGDPDGLVRQCRRPIGYLDLGDDCDDSDSAVTGPLNWLADNDDDGFGGGAVLAVQCDSPGAYHAPSNIGLDCDDNNANRNPLATEICNGIDDDCDLRVDDADGDVDAESSGTEFYPDADGDGHGSDSVSVWACNQPAGTAPTNQDCDDSNPNVSPNGHEICNGGVDDDCTGSADDADSGLDLTTLLIWFHDGDGDGLGDAADADAACARPLNHVSNSADCDDTDGNIGSARLWFYDEDLDGAGDGINLWPAGPVCAQPAADYAPLDAGVDCEPSDPAIFPEAIEICGDGIDQDCTGEDDCTLFAEDWETGTIEASRWAGPMGEAIVVGSPSIDDWSLNLGGSFGAVESNAMDTSPCGTLVVEMWTKRGPIAPTFAEALTLSYWDGASWQPVFALVGNGSTSPSFLFQPVYISDSRAMHGNFMIRFENNGINGDFYLDDLTVTCL